jgi:hypothetical protein
MKYWVLVGKGPASLGIMQGLYDHVLQHGLSTSVPTHIEIRETKTATPHTFGSVEHMLHPDSAETTASGIYELAAHWFLLYPHQWQAWPHRFIKRTKPIVKYLQTKQYGFFLSGVPNKDLWHIWHTLSWSHKWAVGKGLVKALFYAMPTTCTTVDALLVWLFGDSFYKNVLEYLFLGRWGQSATGVPLEILLPMGGSIDYSLSLYKNSKCWHAVKAKQWALYHPTIPYSKNTLLGEYHLGLSVGLHQWWEHIEKFLGSKGIGISYKIGTYSVDMRQIQHTYNESTKNATTVWFSPKLWIKSWPFTVYILQIADYNAKAEASLYWKKPWVGMFVLHAQKSITWVKCFVIHDRIWGITDWQHYWHQRKHPFCATGSVMQVLVSRQYNGVFPVLFPNAQIDWFHKVSAIEKQSTAYGIQHKIVSSFFQLGTAGSMEKAYFKVREYLDRLSDQIDKGSRLE